MISRRSAMVVGLAVLLLGGYLLMSSGGQDGAPAGEAPSATLGPVDGRDLPAQDTGRVRVGDPAPDFSLLAYSDDIVTLSDFRGDKNIVLAFYRGHW